MYVTVFPHRMAAGALPADIQSLFDLLLAGPVNAEAGLGDAGRPANGVFHHVQNLTGNPAPPITIGAKSTMPVILSQGIWAIHPTTNAIKPAIPEIDATITQKFGDLDESEPMHATSLPAVAPTAQIGRQLPRCLPSKGTYNFGWCASAIHFCF